LQWKEASMLVTLVAILCNGQMCLEKVVTTSDESGINLMSCQVQGQIGISHWMQNGPYRSWTLKGWKCVPGAYVPRGKA
jgi:hypothetical protein